MTAPTVAHRLVAPPPPPQRRGPAWIAILMVAGLLAGVFAVGGVMIASTAPYAAGGRCDPSLLTAASTRDVSELSTDQLATARAIVDTGRKFDVAPRGMVVALATAMQESRLRNLDYGHLDSLGAFQQRPSQGWGSPAQVRDVGYAAEQFYRRLLDVRGWEELPVTVAAQAVQRSALPGAYARWEGLGAALVASLGQVADVSGCVASPPDPAAGGTGGTAIEWARGQLGKPYRWGATGPGFFDCSGLVLRAFASAGVTVPRVSRDQFRAGRHVPRAAAQPGDLLFWARNPANPATIYHVAIFIGDNQILEAPYTGAQVRIRPLKDTERGLLGVAVRPGAPADPAVRA